ncbi:hypothetical protein JL720_13169 [Aureococcus anophagefferens]|nr:hypothetical protein JL720_13169 [Aureococcus anophagefferens]
MMATFTALCILGSARALQLGGPYTLHAYEHCQFCTRTRFVLGWAGVPFETRFYGYGEGADPEKCGGFGYDPEAGTVPLTGKKACPVLEGDGVPTLDGARGLAESMEIVSYAVGVGSKVAPATNRKDVADWLDRVGDTRNVDDAILLPILRAMTVTKAVEWPPRVREYLDTACEAANVDTFAKYAC